jgi:aryl-alcohol dehydrogenase-like predicted oxidoreductase
MSLSKLGIGTVQFGLPYGISNTNGQTSAEEVSKILQVGAEHGVNLLDTASAYGNAETVIGKNDLTKFNLVSKYITPTADNTIEKQLHSSIYHLQLKNLYGYLAHRPAEILNDKLQWKILKDFQQKGLVEKVGFSLNTTDELQALLNKEFIPDLIQVPYNYFDNRFENLMQQLKERGCEIHTRSAFLQGLFFKDANTLPSFFDIVKPLIKRVQQQTTNISGALLHFAVAKPFIDKVIIGVENAQQLHINIRDLKLGIELDKNTITIPEQILMPSNWPKQ